jgi:hypothetical protein
MLEKRKERTYLPLRMIQGLKSLHSVEWPKSKNRSPKLLPLFPLSTTRDPTPIPAKKRSPAGGKADRKFPWCLDANSSLLAFRILLFLLMMMMGRVRIQWGFHSWSDRFAPSLHGRARGYGVFSNMTESIYISIRCKSGKNYGRAKTNHTWP